MGALSRLRDWVKERFAKPYVYPPSPGYPEPMRVGALISLLRRYIPPTTRPNDHPEWTPVKVHLPIGKGMHKVFDVAYVAYEPNARQIIVTLRVDDLIGGV